MKVVRRILILTCIFLLFFTRACEAAVSLGIWPGRFDVDARPFRNHTAYVFLFNPGESDVNVTVEFKCKNCVEDLKILGFEIAKVRSHLNVEMIPSTLVVEGGTSPYFPKNVSIRISNSGLMKKQIEMSLFGRDVKIPYYELILDEREFKGEIVATTIGTKILLSVTSSVGIVLHGVRSVLFFVAVCGILLAIASLVYYHCKKI